MCDEYQDSNQVQETLLNSISREREGQPNIFMVGDVKQSIYRFRMAEPEIFLESIKLIQRKRAVISESTFIKIFEAGPVCLRVSTGFSNL
ncbi:MAG: UvrD-helicase domain-containing protein [Frisingicoccus sp.]